MLFAAGLVLLPSSVASICISGARVCPRAIAGLLGFFSSRRDVYEQAPYPACSLLVGLLSRPLLLSKAPRALSFTRFCFRVEKWGSPLSVVRLVAMHEFSG